jgi:5-methylcytosine-specific restriction endonuclease McrA
MWSIALKNGKRREPASVRWRHLPVLRSSVMATASHDLDVGLRRSPPRSPVVSCRVAARQPRRATRSRPRSSSWSPRRRPLPAQDDGGGHRSCGPGGTSLRAR